MNARNGFENFFSVTKIELVLFVTRKLTAKRMEDRKNHGLVYYEKPYGKLTFGDKIITPQAGQIVYFPQGTSYDVATQSIFLHPICPRRNRSYFVPKRRNKFFRTFCAPKKPGRKNSPATRNNAFRACMPSSPT